MDYTTIKDLIKAVSESGLTSFEFKCDGTQINMKKECEKVVVKENSVLEAAPTQVRTVEEPKVQKEEVKEPVKEEKVEENCNVVKSPIVGTFYKASAPGDDAFASVGDKVKKGQVLCIVEAMKLMNEIESEFDGEVVEVLAEDGQMVEYGQPLFKIK